MPNLEHPHKLGGSKHRESDPIAEVGQHIEQQMRGLEHMEQGVESLAQNNDQADLERLEFDESRLDSVEGIQEQLLLYDMRRGQLHLGGEDIMRDIVDFEETFRKFNDQQMTSARGIVRSIQNIFSQDPEIRIAREALEHAQIRISIRIRQFQGKKRQAEAFEQKLLAAMSRLRENEIQERDEKLAQAALQGQAIDRRSAQTKNQYALFETKKNDLTNVAGGLQEYRAELVQQSDAESQLQGQSNISNSRLQEFQQGIEESLAQIDEALAQNPPALQRHALESARQQLLGHGGNVHDAMGQASEESRRSETRRGQLATSQEQVVVQGQTIQAHLNRVVDPTLTSLSQAIDALELAQLKNGTQAEVLEAHYIESLQHIDDLSHEMERTIFQNRVSSERMLQGLISKKRELNNFSVETNLGKQFFGFITHSGRTAIDFIGQSARAGFGELASRRGLDRASRWLKEKTKDIPVVNFLTQTTAGLLLDVPSGILEGTGELIHGVTTLIAHPLDTLAGVSALVPIYNGTNGRWFDFKSTGRAWTSMGKALIAYENFERGEIGKGIGKVGFNVLLTVTGAEAAQAGARGGSIAFRVARASEQGMFRSGLRVAGTGANLFTREYASRLGEMAVTAGRNIKNIARYPLRAPANGLRALRNLRNPRLAFEQRMQGLKTSIERAGNEMDALHQEIGTLQLQPFVAREIEDPLRLSGQELLELGIDDAASIQRLLRYRALRQHESEIAMSIRDARAEIARMESVEKLVQLDPEFLHALGSPEALRNAIDRFNARNTTAAQPDGLAWPGDLLYEGDSGIVAMDVAGKLRYFQSIDQFNLYRDFFMYRLDQAPRTDVFLDVLREHRLRARQGGNIRIELGPEPSAAHDMVMTPFVEIDENILREAQILLDEGMESVYYTGTHSEALQGLRGTDYTLLSSEALAARGVPIRTGELSSQGGALLHDDVYGGRGYDGLATALSYGYRDEVFRLDNIPVERAEWMMERILNLRQRINTLDRDTLHKLLGNPSNAFELSPWELREQLRQRTDQWGERLSWRMAQERLPTEQRFPVIFGLRAEGHRYAVQISSRGRGSGLSGEVTLGPSVSLRQQLSDIFVPRAHIAEAHEFIRGAGMQGVRVHSTEALTYMLTYAYPEAGATLSETMRGVHLRSATVQANALRAMISE